MLAAEQNRPVEAEVSDSAIRVNDVAPLDPAIATRATRESPFEGTSVQIAPNPPVRGRLLSLTLEIPNQDTRHREFTVEGELGVEALFLAGTDGARVVERSDATASTRVIWPRLVLPARTSGRLHLKAIVRSAYGGGFNAHFNIRTKENTEVDPAHAIAG